MDPIPARVRSLWDAWDLRILVLLSLTLQIILSLFGSRRKYISSLWINILVWSTYLMADWVATVALGKLSDAQSNHENGNALWAIWAPLLLLHLGGPDSITAYSLEDNQLWLRHFFGLVVQFSVAVYVVLMSWKCSWFSIMSIPALVAGFIKYGERTWVLMLASHDKSGNIVPFAGNKSTWEDQEPIHVSEVEEPIDVSEDEEPILVSEVEEPIDVSEDEEPILVSEVEEPIKVLYLAHKLLRLFKEYMQNYDLANNPVFHTWTISSERFGRIISEGYRVDGLFWNALEVEMGLMFDLLYTKAIINYSKVGWILRCITFGCTVTVLVGLIIRLIFMRENGEKWDEVDIAITVTLLVGALALEIYAIIALYLCSDWAMLWLIKHNRSDLVIQLRKKISWLSPPKQCCSKTMGQFNLVDFWIKGTKPDQNLFRRILGPLLGIDSFKNKFNVYMHKTVVTVPTPLFDAILAFSAKLNRANAHDIIGNIKDDIIDKIKKRVPEHNIASLDLQIIVMHVATEIWYHIETEMDIEDGSENSTVSQHKMPPSDSSSSWEENKKLCRTLSHYMMHLLFECPSLLPITTSNIIMSNKMIRSLMQSIQDERDVKTACKKLSEHPHYPIFGLPGFTEQPNYESWENLKFSWLKILFHAASKGSKNEHLGQLTQGGEFITLVWFLLPPLVE